MATDRVKDYGAFNELPTPTRVTPPAAPVNDPFYLGTGTTKTVTINGQSYTGVDVGSTKPPAAGGVGSISPATGQVITGADRSKAKEAEAIAIGYTKEYIAARGGINAQGYYNDVPLSGQLTAAEQAQVRNPDGSTNTAAMATILQEKQIKELVSSGLSLAEATNKVSSQYGEYGVPQIAGVGGTGGAAGAGGAAGTSGLSTTSTSGMSAAKMDAIAAITALLSSYGIGDLSVPITEAVQKGYTSDTIQLIMQDPNSSDPLAVAFQKRFPANKARLAAGKSVLSAAEYLAAERTYTQVMQSYGVANIATKDTLNSFISNDISAAEVADRVDLAVNRVKNADPFTKAALAEYYPSLNQSDIVGALLNPAEGLPALKRKITIGEIGGAAAVQGLKTGLATQSDIATGYEGVTTGSLGAEALAQFGITQDQARKGYQTVAEIAPRAEFLSSISGGEDYTRLQAEQEAFLGLASAKRARQALVGEEQARFQGSAGVGPAGLSTTYLRKSTSAGQF
jgi:hypothetical protein